jgi:hypothetical protein
MARSSTRILNFWSELSSRFHHCHHTNPLTYNLSPLVSNKHFSFNSAPKLPIRIRGQGLCGRIATTVGTFVFLVDVSVLMLPSWRATSTSAKAIKKKKRKKKIRKKRKEKALGAYQSIYEIELFPLLLYLLYCI